MKGGLIAGVLWMAALAALGGLLSLGTMGESPATAVVDVDVSYGPPPSPPPPSARETARRLGTWGGWRVVDEISAQRIAVVHVELERLDEASKIAAQLVEPYKSRYSEVLVYFRKPGLRGLLPNLRIQWTPRDGYREIWYENAGR